MKTPAETRVLCILCLITSCLTGPFEGKGQPVEAWARRYGNFNNSYDQGNKVAADASGNVIVAGSSDSGSFYKGILVIKYSSAGTPLWTNLYNAAAFSWSEITGLAVDAVGAVVVGGYSTGADSDYVTIKYSASGTPLWTNRYSGTANGDDRLTALALDSSGNVFVTGWSPVIGTAPIFVTIKYSGDGTPVWTNTYTAAYRYDLPFGLAVDNSDNVVVTGVSDPGTPSGYATVKYSNSGVPLWTNRFNTAPFYAGDAPRALAVDASANVYVTGFVLNGSFFDYGTVAYSAAGVPLWTNLYNGPGNGDDKATAMATDIHGNVFVTGYSTGVSGYYEYATIKYSGAGAPIWTNRYHGLSLSNEVANAIALDANGNVFVTGNAYSSPGDIYSDYTTVAYSNDGFPLWTNRYNGPAGFDDQANAVVVAANGNVLVTGSSARAISTSSGIATIAYSVSGVPLWTNFFNGSHSAGDAAYAVAVDTSGNVFVTGSSSGNSISSYATLKYSSTGVPLWTNRYHGPTNWDDGARYLAIDKNGNVFVTGSSNGGASSNDFATVCYSSDGIPLWTNRYNGPGNGNDIPTGMLVDNSKVVVTGYSMNTNKHYAYSTVAYLTAGVPLWTNRFNGPTNLDDRPTSIAIDHSGNVFVSGFSQRGFAAGGIIAYDFATIAYSSAGLPLWTNRYNGPGASSTAASVAVDSDGNVIVNGASDGAGFKDSATVKYSGAGVPIWTNRFRNNGNNFPSALAVDNNGSVLVTGSSGFIGSDYATIKYSSGGSPLWTNFYNGSVDGQSRPTAVVVNSAGDVFVTGYAPNSGLGYDYTTLTYSSQGVPLSTNRYNGPGNIDDQAYAMALAPDGVVVVGSSYGQSTGLDYAVVKYVNAVNLTAVLTNSQFSVSWPVDHVGWKLQMQTNLSGGINNDWVTIVGSAATNRVIFPIESQFTSAFFRLVY